MPKTKMMLTKRLIALVTLAAVGCVSTPQNENGNAKAARGGAWRRGGDCSFRNVESDLKGNGGWWWDEVWSGDEMWLWLFTKSVARL